ncbi:4Fe-4S dicluster domain-containing protein [Desulfobulbus rhabdoformis]|uniref:pyridine nucleotide-disulfide oxidoreductase/dicluster-binding protein n=1 Tax=Desulfobulbus rhabdoformis TaxID=34032 RepID=UPI00196232A7|nr:pyridine nucleotide-disulfide oxidoreductase/dicluster-binding protein [Desulfobulbus rhabdoformis]MBM9614392.1 4Fe-4S dicluster domain-containing protein [Desulfobulbus rhabdoformis]
MNQIQLRELESKCIQEEYPFCSAACPIHVDVRAFMASLAKGDTRGARRVLDRTMPFPEILGRICDQPCRSQCKRVEIDAPLAIGRLEQFCVGATNTVIKLPKLPSKGGKFAILGAGLSGMTAALDLSRKGRPATIFTSSASPGGSLQQLEESILPGKVFAHAQEMLAHYGVEIQTSINMNQENITALVHEYDAVYCDLDDLDQSLLPFAPNTVDAITLATDQAGCFAGGGKTAEGSFSPVYQAEQGRRAALSIERFIQNVSMTAQREKEGACATRMYTSIEGIAPTAEITPGDEPAGYTAEEAKNEAGRCIQCECLECVKQCVYLQEYKEYPKPWIRKIFNSQTIVQGTRAANKMINACSLCGQCSVICPNDFPVAEVCRSSRVDLVETGHMPPSPHEFALEDMEFSLSDYCALVRHQPGTTRSSYVFYPGCQLSGSNPEAVKQTYAFLRDTLGGGVGLLLGCCGIPAHWAGRDQLFAETMEAFTKDVERLGNPTVITACTSCLSVFKEFVPNMNTVSLWNILDKVDLPTQTTKPARALTLHDPCTTREQSELRASVRSLCEKLKIEVVEHDFTGETTDCCGYGGLMQYANRKLGEKAVARKAERSELDGLAYCAMCRDNLAAHGRPVAHLLDYLFATTEDDPLSRTNPGYSRRHENRARLKSDLLANLWQEETIERPAHTAIKIQLNAEVEQLLNNRLILLEDLQKVIHHAENSGSYLLNPNNGHRLAKYRPIRVTYWVKYEPIEEGFLVHNGYSHRMILPEDQK